MLKLTTDKHEASRGLSATAELLVQVVSGEVTKILTTVVYTLVHGPVHAGDKVEFDTVDFDFVDIDAIVEQLLNDNLCEYF